MKYKGKKVSRHRYRQLTKTKQNYRKMLSEKFLAFHPTLKKLNDRSVD